VLKKREHETRKIQTRNINITSNSISFIQSPQFTHLQLTAHELELLGGRHELVLQVVAMGGDPGGRRN
jgi:hypothetical protein